MASPYFAETTDTAAGVATPVTVPVTPLAAVDDFVQADIAPISTQTDSIVVSVFMIPPLVNFDSKPYARMIVNFLGMRRLSPFFQDSISLVIPIYEVCSYHLIGASLAFPPHLTTIMVGGNLLLFESKVKIQSKVVSELTITIRLLNTS